VTTTKLGARAGVVAGKPRRELVAQVLRTELVLLASLPTRSSPECRYSFRPLTYSGTHLRDQTFAVCF